ncbi:MAG: RsmB/NOP family class I SAM-dependent RNA methyltransferase [Hyphomonadaceae bacterium]|nr:RsmB/NOP family class I SAM-dependent RNA methyltransferase [Hyphomonadaceae bacterium]
MRVGARAQAAIEILTDMEARRRPAADAVKDWMLTHRFAGSKDRAEIGDIVFGALRWKASSAFRFGADTPRAAVWGAQRFGFGVPAASIVAACAEPHAPAPPTEAERAALFGETPESRLEGAPAWVAGDYPEWLDAAMTRAFGEARSEEGAHLAAPAPLDLRVNTLKAAREKIIEALADSPRLLEPPQPTRFAPDGVRIPWAQGRTFPWATEQAFVKGWFEVQDEGSQIAAMLAGAVPGTQVADVCAGGGGKTLALAAAMRNKGQIYAFDVDGRRLAPIHERLERAGVRNVQVRAPGRTRDVLEDLRDRMDLVLVDAPCSGSGTWRRAPDSKWRLRPNALATRLEEQQQALDLAAPLVKPGGRLAYVTCSVLPEENGDAVEAFLRRDSRFVRAPLAFLDATLAGACGVPVGASQIQMTPKRTGTDGFFAAALMRA